MNVYEDGVPAQNAVVKISQGAKVWPLTNTDSKGNVLAYVPAGKYNVVVYALNGTTMKNYTIKSLNVIAGQRSQPFAQQQIIAGTVGLSVNTISGGDKKITGTTVAGSTVTARDGVVTLGTAKADKSGNFSISLKKPQPGKTITLTAVDTAENEKNVDVQVPLVAAVTLTAATKSNDVGHDFVITFKDKVGLLVNTVTSVTYDGFALAKDTDYKLAAGKLTIMAGAVKAAGTHTFVVKSSAYEDATVIQVIKAGAANGQNRPIH